MLSPLLWLFLAKGRMLFVNPSLRFVPPIIERCLLYSKILFRTLTLEAMNTSRKHHIQMRKYSTEWSPNIIKSPFPKILLPDKSFTDYLWSRNDNWNDLPAVVCGLTDREMNYRELRQLCRKFAASLLSSGFKAGQVIAIVLPNVPEFPIVSLGALEAGLIVTTINPINTPDEMSFQIKDSGAVGVITLRETLNTVLEAKKKTKNDSLRVICGPNVTGEESNLPANIEPYSQYISNESDSIENSYNSPDDVAFIPYSSGTTGIPKGVCLTHRNLISSLASLKVIGDCKEPVGNTQDILPFILPGFHIYGFSVIMCQTLMSGGKIVTLPKFEETSFLKVLKDCKPTLLYVAPPLVMYLGSSPNVTRDHLKYLRIIISGAAPVAESDILKCVRKSPPTVLYKQGYGLTETSPAVAFTASLVKKYNSVGPPVPNTEVKVIDLQTGQPLGPNEEGEICVRGPQVMKGYLNKDKATSETIDSDGWLHTGDIGYYDEDKDLFITERLKELIKVKAFQVAPAELEAVLRAHPDVLDCGVIGIPDEKKGETPVGFIQLRPGIDIKAIHLKEYLKGKVAKYKMIDKFVFVESVPKSASGKILRRKLKEDFLKGQC